MRAFGGVFVNRDNGVIRNGLKLSGENLTVDSIEHEGGQAVSH